jgi:hypothetical protein
MQERFFMPGVRLVRTKFRRCKQKGKYMKYLAMIALALALFLPAQARAQSNADQRAAIQKMENDTLARLYAEKPGTRDEIRHSVGYAVL